MPSTARLIVASLFLPSGVQFANPAPASPSLSTTTDNIEPISEEGQEVAPPASPPAPSYPEALGERPKDIPAVSLDGTNEPYHPKIGLGVLPGPSVFLKERSLSGLGPGGIGGVSGSKSSGIPSTPGLGGGFKSSQGLSIIDDLTKASKAPSPSPTPGVAGPVENPFFPTSTTNTSTATPEGNKSPIRPAAGDSAGVSLINAATRALNNGSSKLASAVQDATRGVRSEMSLPGTPRATPSGSASASSQKQKSRSPVISQPSQAFHPPPLNSPLTRATSRSSSRRRSSSSHSVFPPHHHALQLIRNPQGNIGLQNALHAIEGETKGMVWVGALADKTDELSESTRVDVEAALWEGDDGGVNRSKPVWINDSVFEGFYDVFCKQILWPTFHYSTVRKDETTNWEDYVRVNQSFADRIVETYKDGDTIFVNDYHLLLVPAMVRAKLPKSIIGLFVHIAFPSSEIFRCLALREELLYGMLGANLIGFQTYNFSRHFRQVCSRVLQDVEATPKGIQLPSSFVDVEVFGIGIDVDTLEAKREEQEVTEWANLLRERYGDTKLIVARDKLDEVKGLKHKLLSFERFLQLYPEWIGKVVLIQVALATTETNEAQENIHDLVTRINSKFSNSITYQPIVFLHTEPPTFSQYLGLLTTADVFINTSLREGMNLTAHEFVRCQEGSYGPMILSEFTGSYSYSSFRSCLPVNPYDYSQVARAINQALTMGEEEKKTRWTELNAHVVDHTAQAWARKYLSHLERAHAGQQSRLPNEIPKFEVSAIQEDYRHAGTRLLLVDLEGVVWNEDPRKTHAEGFNPPAELLDQLKMMTDDPNTVVYLLSGRGVTDLKKIQAAVPKLGLLAEHGCYIKLAGDDANQDWVCTVENLDLSWRAPCIEILNYFSERTPGAYIEDRGTSLVWRFCNEKSGEAESAWAKRAAAEAANHVSDVLAERYKLQIYPGKQAFLVVPRQVTRSHAVALLLSKSSNLKVLPSHFNSSLVPQYDFVAALTTDERLIAALNSLKQSRSRNNPRGSVVVHTVSAGTRQSQAKWACNTVDAAQVLVDLVKDV
ncbi:Trehalose-6-phosphate synthase component TPS1 and related subunits [Phaffia rhodozyma]|uniref:Trehalose-6-phosphate synthase component TPS1 and related subunits n=1 Tax=Phaffia rhodozyma TaxID=264483 RepID=A0A0F7SYJ8_PHARH|nr:Trehalose-6-phosphate synthase component TPS1 and related subunits [Phaffia rhodozyma]